jgi:hypothetical protein
VFCFATVSLPLCESPRRDQHPIYAGALPVTPRSALAGWHAQSWTASACLLSVHPTAWIMFTPALNQRSSVCVEACSHFQPMHGSTTFNLGTRLMADPWSRVTENARASTLVVVKRTRSCQRHLLDHSKRNSTLSICTSTQLTNVWFPSSSTHLRRRHDSRHPADTQGVRHKSNHRSCSGGWSCGRV